MSTRNDRRTATIAVLLRVLAPERDVVAIAEAPVDLTHRVLRDGILVLETDHRRRLEFEVRARNEYWDLLPILELYRGTVLRDA
ncbi:MAG: hypothetical protein HZB39_17980 [Planctomycetes bacterium]|nr:hypothetical protein [Planctomycetota bacterium]